MSWDWAHFGVTVLKARNLIYLILGEVDAPLDKAETRGRELAAFEVDVTGASSASGERATSECFYGGVAHVRALIPYTVRITPLDSSGGLQVNCSCSNRFGEGGCPHEGALALGALHLVLRRYSESNPWMSPSERKDWEGFLITLSQLQAGRRTAQEAP